MNNYIKKIIFSLLPVTIGGIIYISYRPKSLLMFKWFKYLEIENYIHIIRFSIQKIPLPEFFIYSLPNGLWLFSFLAFIMLTTKDKIRIILIIFCIFTTMSFEVLQIVKLIPGVFCFKDIFINILSIVVCLKTVKKRCINEIF